MSPAPQPRRRLPLVAILVGVVAVLVVGAIVVNALSKDDASGADSGANGSVAQVRPVTIDGEGLPRFPGNGEADSAVGTVAPTIDGASFVGTSESIGGKTGKPTLVMFVAHWCPHCQREVPRVVEWRADGTVPAEIDLVAVSTAVASDQNNYPPSTWLDKVGWPGRIIADDSSDSAAAAYGLTGYPYFVALDADGNVVARGSGELDQAGIEAIVSQLQVG